MALDTSGTLHAWGYNVYGQLGDGTTVNKSTPFIVNFGTLISKTIVSVVGGNLHTMALDTSGTVHAWGYNGNGQLGDTTLTDKSTPIMIGLNSTNTTTLFMNFTGQHRCFVNGYNNKTMQTIAGLIVCANNNKYITTSEMLGGDRKFTMGKNAITTNDALPLVSLSSKAKDKQAFGVVSIQPNYDMKDVSRQLDLAIEQGDVRTEINSVGEGAIWVCDAGGPLESGDCIMTSAIPGYGTKQDDDFMHNYTVAKITMDCDFTAPLIDTFELRKDEFGNNVVDTNGFPIYDGVMISSRTVKNEDGTETIEIVDPPVPQVEPSYELRYLQGDGTHITKDEYDAAILANNSSVFRAAFVGCTYHCG
jgi:YD repeat-containing protein